MLFYGVFPCLFFCGLLFFAVTMYEYANDLQTKITTYEMRLLKARTITDKSICRFLEGEWIS